MKRLFSILISALLLMACGGGDDGGGSTPSGGSEYLNVGDVEIPGGNTTATIKIQASNNCDWVITYSDAWILGVSPTKGRGSQNATVTVTANPSSTGSRTAVMTVKNLSGTITRNIAITQTANTETSFRLSTTELAAEAVGSTVQFSIVGNASWTVASNASWAVARTISGSGNADIVVAVSDNLSESSREAVITVSSSSNSERVKIVQAAGSKPTVSDVRILNTDKTEVTLEFSYTSLFAVSEYGVCYDTADGPSIERGSVVKQTGSAKQGTPSLKLTDLTPGVTYYVRAYATSSVGTQYSPSVSFNTSSNKPGDDDVIPPYLD